MVYANGRVIVAMGFSLDDKDPINSDRSPFDYQSPGSRPGLVELRSRPRLALTSIPRLFDVRAASITELRF